MRLKHKEKETKMQFFIFTSLPPFPLFLMFQTHFSFFTSLSPFPLFLMFQTHFSFLHLCLLSPFSVCFKHIFHFTLFLFCLKDEDEKYKSVPFVWKRRIKYQNQESVGFLCAERTLSWSFSSLCSVCSFNSPSKCHIWHGGQF